MSLALVALGGTALLALLGATPLPALLLAGTIALTVLALTLGWALYGRETVSGATLARIPLYLAWKIPVYLRLVRKRETQWVRTGREGERAD
jgi:hypothetical protein